MFSLRNVLLPHSLDLLGVLFFGTNGSNVDVDRRRAIAWFKLRSLRHVGLFVLGFDKMIRLTRRHPLAIDADTRELRRRGQHSLLLLLLLWLYYCKGIQWYQ